jgi:serine protease Do
MIYRIFLLVLVSGVRCLAQGEVAAELDDAFGLKGAEKKIELTEGQAGTDIEALAESVRESLVVVTQIGRDGTASGTGTGFIISEDGLIATCNHVIGEARQIKVEMADGSLHDVTAVHAWDRKLDLAVIRIDKAGLRPLKIGDSDTLKQGAEIAAMGNPHGLDFSVVGGVVSAIRDLGDGDVPLFQLAIPIEPGNSGSPLLDLEGNVHGVLSMKSTVTRNLGFAVPINNLSRMLERPNSLPMKSWLTIGAMNPRKWKPIMGATWRQRAGRIVAENPGIGFGGRSLCIFQNVPEKDVYEISVELLMGDESGAAGLIFASDGDEKHYGFYPSSGQMRLTRFDGPDVFSWNVLSQFDCAEYQRGEWNTIRVRVEPEKIIGFVNGAKVIEFAEKHMRGGKVGLAKFRDTRVEFRSFKLGDSLEPPKVTDGLVKLVEAAVGSSGEAAAAFDLDALNEISADPGAAKLLIFRKKRELELELARLDELKDAVHRKLIAEEMAAEFAKPEDKIDLANVGLQISRLDNSEVDTAGYLEEIERMAAEISESFPEGGTALEKLQRLSTYLFEENGYHGSRDDYYNRSNSYLSAVIDDREGIPVTLSLLYIDLARRIGVKDVVGLGLPGHFVAQYRPDEDPESWTYIDVFEGGKFITEAEADGIVHTHGNEPEGAAVQFNPSTKREIATRILTNLKTAAIDEEDYKAAVRYVDLSILLNPADGAEHLSRALLLLQSGGGAAAKPDLEWLFENKPEGIRLERLRELYDQL